MNIAKHMEAIFVTAALALCALSYTPASLNQEELASQAVESNGAVQTVVIVAKRA